MLPFSCAASSLRFCAAPPPEVVSLDTASPSIILSASERLVSDRCKRRRDGGAKLGEGDSCFLPPSDLPQTAAEWLLEVRRRRRVQWRSWQWSAKRSLFSCFFHFFSFQEKERNILFRRSQRSTAHLLFFSTAVRQTLTDFFLVWCVKLFK